MLPMVEITEGRWKRWENNTGKVVLYNNTMFNGSFIKLPVIISFCLGHILRRTPSIIHCIHSEYEAYDTASCVDYLLESGAMLDNLIHSLINAHCLIRA